MKIELKGFKFYESMSDDTNCYEAIVYVDGKKAFYANNHGTGGPDFYTPIDHALYNKAMAYVKSLPPHSDKYGEMAMDMELFIGDLIDEKLAEKEVKKLLKKTVMVDGGNLYTLKAVYSEALKVQIMKKYPTAIVLNSLSFEDAVKVFRNL
jgi:hypothetical protein